MSVVVKEKSGGGLPRSRKPEPITNWLLNPTKYPTRSQKFAMLFLEARHSHGDVN